jgi:hypothetical protein
MSTREKPRAPRGNYWGSGGAEQAFNLPRVSVYRNSGVVPGSGAPYVVEWDVAEYNEDGMWSVNDPTVVKCTTAGLYDVLAWGTWEADATVTRRMLLTKTTPAGVATLYFNPGAEIPAVGAGLSTMQSVNFHVPMSPRDTLAVTVTQFTAGALGWVGATPTSRANGFQACLISTT